jgi:hypothetical protein
MNDLNTHALRLLQFVEDSVNEATEDAASRKRLLVEADCALTVLGATLRRKAPEKHALAALFIDYDLPRIGEDNPDPTEKLGDALEVILRARAVFGVVS